MSRWLVGALGVVVGGLIGMAGTWWGTKVPGHAAETQGAGTSQAPLSAQPTAPSDPSDPCADLRAQLEVAQFSGALAKGQLQAAVGEPTPWPDDIDPEDRPEGVQAKIDAFLATHESLSLAELDCSEYPCMAVFHGPSLHQTGGEALGHGLKESIGATMQRHIRRSGGPNQEPYDTYLMGITSEPPEDGSDAKVRLEHRMDLLIKEQLAVESAPPGEPAEGWELEKHERRLAELEAERAALIEEIAELQEATP